MTFWPGVLRSESELARLVACGSVMAGRADAGHGHGMLDPALTERAATGLGTSRVIVTFKPGGDALETISPAIGPARHRAAGNRQAAWKISP